MPYINIHGQNYEDTLYIYTVALVNGRYDIIDPDSLTEESGYSNKAPETHSFDKVLNSSFWNVNSADESDRDPVYYYNAYHTYRKNIAYDSSLLLLNETLIPTDILNKNTYNVDYNSKNNIFRILMFNGIAINYDYPINGRMATLEDIFAEYFYDYIVAWDKQYQAEYKVSYYFDETLQYSLLYSYSILPIGDTYIGEDEDDTHIIQYDGTTVPTVEQIISGTLYIVIKSGNQKARKIYFNNLYGPSLFVNDDKYNVRYISNNAETMKTNNFQYILNNNQIMRLCDISRFRSFGWNLVFHANYMCFTRNFFNGVIDTNKYKQDTFTISGSNIQDVKWGICLRTFALIYTTEIDKIYSIVSGTLNAIETGSATFSKSLISFTQDSSIFEQDSTGHYYLNENNPIVKTSSYLFKDGFIMGGVLKPKTVEEKTDFIFAVIPSIYVMGYNLTGNPVNSSAKDNTFMLTKSTNSNDIAEIFFSYDASILLNYITPEDIKESNPSPQWSHALTEPAGFNPDYINFNPVGLPLKGEKVFSYKISDIPFKDLQQYQMVNVVNISVSDNPITIILSDKSVRKPGFFIPNIEEEDLEPVWLEEVEDNMPLFVKIVKD